ncbi:MAG: HpcH/HpaI aldolase family protein [Anaerolineae bacterium]
MRTNTVKRKLNAGEVSVGTWLTTNSALMAEALAHQGFDWLVVDMEHSSASFETMQHMAQAISTTETIPMARVAWNHPAFIKRALDMGAYGVVIPLVMNAEEARTAVRWTRYPPEGYRGVGGMRRVLYGGPDYFERANGELLLIIQIEHVEAVGRIDEILSVPGVDAVFVGPNDLSASLGLAPRMDNPDPRYEEVLRQIVEAGKRHGVATGIHCGSPAAIQKYASWGMQFFALSSDVGMALQSAREGLAALREGKPQAKGEGVAPVY